LLRCVREVAGEDAKANRRNIALTPPDDANG
jgi:hypothetical protein